MRTSDPGQGGHAHGLLSFIAVWLAASGAVVAAILGLAAAGNEIVYLAKLAELPAWCLYAGDAMRRLSDLIALNVPEVRRGLSQQGQALVGFACAAAWGIVFTTILVVGRRKGVRWQLARWALLICALLFTVLFATSAAYSAWRSGHTPGYEGWWSNRSFAHACFSASTFSFGVAAFLAIRSPARARAGFGFVMAAVLFAVLPSAREFITRDRCLDSGGAFDAATFDCKR